MTARNRPKALDERCGRISSWRPRGAIDETVHRPLPTIVRQHGHTFPAVEFS